MTAQLFALLTIVKSEDGGATCHLVEKEDVPEALKAPDTIAGMMKNNWAQLPGDDVLYTVHTTQNPLTSAIKVAGVPNASQ